MKYLSLILSLALFLLVAPAASAQVTQCITIDAGNYADCCSAPASNATARACQTYVANGYCKDFPDDPQCTPINGPSGGGTQQTNPINPITGEAADNVIFSDDDIPGSGGGIVTQSNINANVCNTKFKSLVDILIWIKCIIVSVLIPLIFVAAFLVFLWGVFRFMTAATAKDKKVGQQVIWWGLLALFVMVSVWGIIKIVGTILGIDSTVPLLQTQYLK